MSSSEFTRKAVTQGGPPLERQPTGVPAPPAPSSSRSKKASARRRLHKERSMRIPAIENDMMNRIGITKTRKAIVRASSPQAAKSRTRTSPYKNMLVGIARTKDGSQASSDAEGNGSGGEGSGGNINLVRCASPEPEAPTLAPSHTSSASSHPLAPEQSTTATSSAEAKGHQRRHISIDLRLPPIVPASSSRNAGSPLCHHLAPPEAHPCSSGASPSKSSSPRKRSPLARLEDSPPAPIVSAPVVDRSTAQPTIVQRETVSTALGSPCVNSSSESDTQSDDSSDLDDPAAEAAQAVAVQKSLLSQIEERNMAKKWDDLVGFFHSIQPGEVCEVLKTASRAGRRALRKFVGKEIPDSGTSNRENDARGRGLGSAQQPLRRERVVHFVDSESDREGEVVNQTTVPPWQSQYLYKAKGKAPAPAKSPSPEIPWSRPWSPPPVIDSHNAGASASTSRASNGHYAPAARKRSRTPESEDEFDLPFDPPTKRQKRNNPRPLKREGAFYHYLPTPTTSATATYDDDDDDAEPQTAPVNLVRNFRNQSRSHRLDVSACSVHECDPFVLARDNDDHEDEDDEWAWAGNRTWSLRAEPSSQDAATDSRRLRRRRTRVQEDGVVRHERVHMTDYTPCATQSKYRRYRREY